MVGSPAGKTGAFPADRKHLYTCLPVPAQASGGAVRCLGRAPVPFPLNGLSVLQPLGK